jgi:PAS domain S-box-containing protein
MSGSNVKGRPPVSESKDRISALKIALIYLVVGGLWIFLSDKLLALIVHNLASVTTFSIVKGCFYVLATAWMLYALIYRDLVAIRRSDRAKIESTENYRRIVETTQEGIWVLDTQSKTTYANQRLADMLGYSVDELIGRSIFDFAPPELHDALETHIRDRIAGRSEQYDFRFLKKDGADLWAIVSGTTVTDGEYRQRGSFAMLTDITRRKFAAEKQKEMEERQKDFYRRTILAATEGKLIITDREEIDAVIGPAIAEWRIDAGEDLAPLRSEVRTIIASCGMSDDRQSDFILCIGEAATNACKHAHCGQASLHRTDQSLIFMVADNGPGIETLILPEVALARRYSTARSLGMGYKAMISLADRIYLSTGPAGTTVAVEMELVEVERPFTLPDLW